MQDSVRGTLLANILQIVRIHLPEFILLENVAHFVNHDKGSTFQKVKEELHSLGYDVVSKELSPHQFGVPQIRQRMYLVGRRGDLGDFRWPEPTHSADQLSIRSVLDSKPTDAVCISDRVRTCWRYGSSSLIFFEVNEIALVPYMEHGIRRHVSIQSEESTAPYLG